MDRIVALLKQYRYGVLVLLIGLGLMLLPESGQDTHPEAEVTSIPVGNTQQQLGRSAFC